MARRRRKNRGVEGVQQQNAAPSAPLAGKKRRRRRTKAEMIAARASAQTAATEAAIPAHTPNEDYDQEESMQRNQQGLPARNSGYDRYLQSELANLNAPWKVVAKDKQSFEVRDKTGKVMATATTEYVADALAVLPHIMVTYSGVSNIFAMTDAERSIYQEALNGLYDFRTYLINKQNKNAGTNNPNDTKQRISELP